LIKSNIEETIAHNYGLLVSISNKYNNSQNEIEDLMQVATIGLIKAYNTWNEKKSTFSTHAYNCINNNLKNYIRNNKRYKLDTISIYEEKAYNEKESFFEYLPDIKDEEFFIIDLKLKGYTRKEISNLLGISKDKLRYKLSIIYQKIRKANETKNIDG
jgi:RNA polymerase sigma factor (sigma-70 family)